SSLGPTVVRTSSEASDEAVQHLTDSLRPILAAGRTGQPAGVCSRQPVLQLVRRAASHEQESGLIRPGSATVCLSDVRADRVGRTDHLHARRPQICRLPVAYETSDVVRELGSESVDVELFEARRFHTTVRTRKTDFGPRPSHESRVTSHEYREGE